jgi:hypothetical protein
MIDVIQVVASIEADKKANHIEPSHAMMSEITNEVTRRLKCELNKGVGEGKLDWCKTINSIAFSIKNTE